MLVIAESDGLSHSTASFVIGSGDEANRFYYRGQPVYWFLKKEDAEKQLERLTSENSSMYDQVQMNALTENLNRTKEELEKINAEHTAEIVSLQEHHGKALVKLEETLAENRTKLKSYEATKVIQEDLNNQMLQTVKATRDVHKQVTDVAVSSNRSSAAASSVEKEELSVWKAGLGVLAAGVGLAFILGKKSAI
jgi:DNA mismatch repair ATPase MutS